MIVIGERINATRKSIQSALSERDADIIRNEATQQVSAGANYIDVNGGTSPEEELENLLWLMEVVQEAVEAPLCIDSASPDAIKEGLSKHKNGRPLINSISMESGRYEEILPVVKEHDAMVVALAMDDSGIPKSADERLKVIEKIVDESQKHGVALSDVFIDPLITALSADTGSGLMAIQVIKGIKERWPEMKTTCGLSNISFGLPNRRLINRSFVAMLISHGLDSAIIDPLDEKLMAVVTASRALVGLDEYCMDYIDAYRAKKLEV